MEITLKNIQHFSQLSDDSNAFSANLYVNNIHVATCTDNGNGGCIIIKPIKGYESILAEAEKFAKTLPNEPVYDLEMDLELIIGGIVENDLWQIEVNKVLKKFEKLHVVSSNSKTEFQLNFIENGSKKKIPIETLLATPSDKSRLQVLITRLKSQGYTIYNKNIPKQMIGADTSNSDKSNNPKT